jgi:hypothetical protein
MVAKRSGHDNITEMKFGIDAANRVLLSAGLFAPFLYCVVTRPAMENADGQILTRLHETSDTPMAAFVGHTFIISGM